LPGCIAKTTRAEYLVLPSGEQRNPFAVWQTLLPSLALVPSLIPGSSGVPGFAYSGGAFILGASFLHYGLRFGFRRFKMSPRDSCSLPPSFIFLRADVAE
jgi:hypothetical protein